MGFTVTNGKIVEIDAVTDPERLRHLEGHGYTASWQTQHHGVLTAQVLQPRRQLSAGVHAIGEDDHGGDPSLTYPSTMLLGGRCRSRCRSDGGSRPSARADP